MTQISRPDARSRPIAAILIAVIASIAFAPAALAFHRHLSPEDVRDAYFIGRDQSHRAAFFAEYVHSPKLSDIGPDVASIAFQTPYEQVALRARDAGDNYFAPDAAQDYDANPIREAIVRIQIFDTQTFYFHGYASAADAAASFKYAISQEGRPIQFRTLTAKGTFTVVPGTSGSTAEPGIDVHLHFGVSQFKSDDPVTVKVLAPTGQTYSTTFDLTALK
jgi:hypothetical protein